VSGKKKEELSDDGQRGTKEVPATYQDGLDLAAPLVEQPGCGGGGSGRGVAGAGLEPGIISAPPSSFAIMACHR
jgi:hypothetical protein